MDILDNENTYILWPLGCTKLAWGNGLRGVFTLWTLSLRSLSLCPNFSRILPSDRGTSGAELGPSSTSDGGGLWHSANVAALGGKSGLRVPHARRPLGVDWGDGASVLDLETDSSSETSSPETGGYSVSELRDKCGNRPGLLLLSGSVSESPQLSPSPSAPVVDAEPPRYSMCRSRCLGMPARVAGICSRSLSSTWKSPPPSCSSSLLNLSPRRANFVLTRLRVLSPCIVRHVYHVKQHSHNTRCAHLSIWIRPQLLPKCNIVIDSHCTPVFTTPVWQQGSPRFCAQCFASGSSAHEIIREIYKINVGTTWPDVTRPTTKNLQRASAVANHETWIPSFIIKLTLMSVDCSTVNDLHNKEEWYKKGQLRFILPADLL
jgi:hypothetical protein